MILKADQIAKRLVPSEEDIDPLVIVPKPNIELLKQAGEASVDLRLGTWFLTLRQARLTHLSVANKDASYEDDIKFARTHYIPFGKEFILHPRSFVLGVTLEWVRMAGDLAGYVIGKSSWGRRGLIIATATGVHPGFTGCLTLELSNIGEIPIAIKPGIKICQLFIHDVKSETKTLSASCFVGRRKPTLGRIVIDELAQKLSEELD